jgi:hypothetical protein
LTTQLPTGVVPFIIIQLEAMALHLVRTRAMLPVPLARRALSSSNRKGTVRTSGKSICHDASQSHGVERNMISIHENIPLWLWPTYRGTRASPSGLTRVVSLPSVKMPSARIAGWGDRMHGQNGSQLQPQSDAGLTMYCTEDKLDTRGHITNRMTYVAMSKLCSHGAHHSRFTLHLAGPVILRPPATTPPSANATALPPSTPASDRGALSSPAGSGSSSDRSIHG